MIPKPSGEPAPRPEETTTLASASETPPFVDACGAFGDAHDLVGVRERRREALDLRRVRGCFGSDDVRRDGEERRRPVDGGFLEQAAAPAEARHPERISGRRLDAVRGERLVEPRGDVRHHLVPALAPGGDDRAGCSRSASSTVACATAAGAYEPKTSCSATC